MTGTVAHRHSLQQLVDGLAPLCSIQFSFENQRQLNVLRCRHSRNEVERLKDESDRLEANLGNQTILGLIVEEQAGKKELSASGVINGS